MIVLNNVSFPFAARSQLFTYPFVTRALKFYYFFVAIRFLLILVAQSSEKKGEMEEFKKTFTGAGGKNAKSTKWGKNRQKRGFGMRQ